MLLRLSSIAIALLLAGCAAFRSYDREVYATLDQAAGGNVDAAIRILESNNRLPDKDLLYYLERGMLERLGERYAESQKTWASADRRIQEQGLLASAGALAGAAGSYLVSDKLRPYLAHDYEKVLLLTYMALNRLALGDFDGARVAIRQTHELEATIAESRARQLAAVEEQARKRGARTGFKELNGYPVETIDNPAVNALRNGYQSALSHYLAGFVYEALGEPSLAAPGYRLANELQPNQPLLEEALAGLDERVRRATQAGDDGMAEVLFIVSSGTAPALHSRRFALPVFAQARMLFVSVSFPVISATWSGRPPALLTLAGGRTLPVTPLTSVDLMARRSLKDDMPGIMLRASIRASASAVAQYQSQRLAESRDSGAAVVGLAALVASTGSALLDSADDRTWRTLPADISVARARLPRGEHDVTLSTFDGQRSARISVQGRYAVVDLRLLRHRMFVHAPKAPVDPAQRVQNKEAST